MLRRSFIAGLLLAVGCSPKRKPLPPPIVMPTPPVPQPTPIIEIPKSDWTTVPGKPNPDRVVLYLSKKPIKVKDCSTGVCRWVNSEHPPSARMRHDLAQSNLKSQGWRVGSTPAQHIQIAEITAEVNGVRPDECPVAVKFRDGREAARTNCSGMTSAWLSHWYSDAAIPCPTEYKKKAASRHVGVSGERWSDYFNHLVSSGNHADCHWLASRMRAMSLDELRAIHDDSHAGGVQWKWFT